MRLYVNGELVANKYVGSETMESDGPLYMGCDGSFGEHFQGRIDDVRIYDRALGAGEL